MLKLLTGYNAKQWLMAAWLLIDEVSDKFHSLDKESKSDIVTTMIGTPIIVAAIVIGMIFVASVFEAMF